MSHWWFRQLVRLRFVKVVVRFLDCPNVPFDTGHIHMCVARFDNHLEHGVYLSRAGRFTGNGRAPRCCIEMDIYANGLASLVWMDARTQSLLRLLRSRRYQTERLAVEGGLVREFSL